MKLRKDRKADRVAEVEKRQKAYDKLSPKEKIAKLDKKLGKGVGAVKQRARLEAELEAK